MKHAKITIHSRQIRSVQFIAKLDNLMVPNFSGKHMHKILIFDETIYNTYAND